MVAIDGHASGGGHNGGNTRYHEWTCAFCTAKNYSPRVECTVCELDLLDAHNLAGRVDKFIEEEDERVYTEMFGGGM